MQRATNAERSAATQQHGMLELRTSRAPESRLPETAPSNGLCIVDSSCRPVTRPNCERVIVDTTIATFLNRAEGTISQASAQPLTPSGFQPTCDTVHTSRIANDDSDPGHRLSF